MDIKIKKKQAICCFYPVISPYIPFCPTSLKKDKTIFRLTGLKMIVKKSKNNCRATTAL